MRRDEVPAALVKLTLLTASVVFLAQGLMSATGTVFGDGQAPARVVQEDGDRRDLLVGLLARSPSPSPGPARPAPSPQPEGEGRSSAPQRDDDAEDAKDAEDGAPDDDEDDRASDDDEDPEDLDTDSVETGDEDEDEDD